MIKCVIIDDEANCRDDLSGLIGYSFKDRLQVCGTAGSVKDGVNIINATLPDVVFLDIRMPEEDGFQLFNRFDPVNFDVVFTTSYEEYAIQAIKHAALDYLLKPVDPNELSAFLNRFDQQTKKNSLSSKIKLLLAQLEAGHEPNILVSLPAGKEFKVVNARDILYCKADINYTEIHTSDHAKFVVTKTLGKVEKILDYPFFFRCHKSFLVNVNHIDSYNKIDGYIRMKNQEVIYLADRKIERFINLFGKEK
jgi:two-component system LytT family response regulator